MRDVEFQKSTFSLEWHSSKCTFSTMTSQLLNHAAVNQLNISNVISTSTEPPETQPQRERESLVAIELGSPHSSQRKSLPPGLGWSMTGGASVDIYGFKQFPGHSTQPSRSSMLSYSYTPSWIWRFHHRKTTARKLITYHKSAQLPRISCTLVVFTSPHFRWLRDFVLSLSELATQTAARGL